MLILCFQFCISLISWWINSFINILYLITIFYLKYLFCHVCVVLSSLLVTICMIHNFSFFNFHLICVIMSRWGKVRCVFYLFCQFLVFVSLIFKLIITKRRNLLLPFCFLHVIFFFYSSILFFLVLCFDECFSSMAFFIVFFSYFCSYLDITTISILTF